MKSNRIKIPECSFTDFHVFNTEKFNTILLFYTLEFPLSKISKKCIPYIYLLPHILKNKFSNSKNPRDLNDMMNNIYARDLEVNTEKKGSNYFLHFEIEVPSENIIQHQGILKESLKLLFDLIFQPIYEKNKIHEDDIEYAHKKVKTYCDIYSSDKFFSSNIRILEEMYPNDFYSLSIHKNKLPLVKNISVDSINRIYENIIKISEKNLYLVGSIDAKQIDFAICERKNYDIYPNCHVNKKIESSNILKNQQTKYISEKDDINQGKILVGIKTKISDSYKSLIILKLTNGILGKFPTSLLFSTLREEYNLCYFITSQVNFDKNHIVITVSTDHSNYFDILKKIKLEINKIISGKISDDLFNQTKLQLISLAKEGLDNPRGILDKLIDSKKFKLESLEDEIELIKSITLAEIIENSSTWHIDTVYYLKNGDNV